MPRKWRTITLPEEVLKEVKENMSGFTSLSEFVRAAIRFYIGHLRQQALNSSLKLKVEQEVPS